MQAYSERQTKYCDAIKDYLEIYKHATNSEILNGLRLKYNSLSATTVHRATTRLASRGKIKIAPPDINGNLRYDNNITEHDHFICNGCGKIKDINIPRKFINVIESSLHECSISGSITISGLCNECNKIKDNYENSF